MADIIITPGSSLMSFTSSLNYTQTLTQQASGSLTLQGSGSTGRTDLFTVNGNNGTLFSVSDDLSNSLFSVNTIAGLPVIEAFADNTVVMGQYGQNVLVVTGSRVGIGTATPSNKLTVYQDGGVRVTGITSGSYIELSGDLPGYSANSYPVIKSSGSIYFANNGKYAGFLEGSNTYFGILDSGQTTRVFLNTGGNSYFTGGNVGIGTTAAPGNRLITSQDATYNNENTYGIAAAASTNNDYKTIIGYDYSNDIGVISAVRAGVAWKNLSLAPVGGVNVGIGTISPQTKLSVHGSQNNTIAPANGVAKFVGGDAGVFVGTLAGTPNYGSWLQAMRESDGLTFPLHLQPNGGNVGIGTTSPGYKLEVNGTSYFSGLAYFGQTSAGGSAFRWGALGSAVSVDTMLTHNQLWNGSGWTILDSGVGTSYLNLGSQVSSPDIQFGTGPTNTAATTKMIIKNGGNVGIGTSSPAVPLDVNGSTNIKGGITGQDSSNNYRYEFAPELAYTRVGVGGVGTYKINSGAVSTTSMLRIKSTSASGWLSSGPNFFNGTVISEGLCDVAISTVGTLLFLNTNGEWGIADADVAAKSVTLLGIALNSTSGVGETVDVLIDGIIALKSNHDQISIPASPGAPLYVSTNSGSVTEVAPAVSGDIVRLVGHNVWSATSPQNTAIIRFQPDNTWIEL